LYLLTKNILYLLGSNKKKIPLFILLFIFSSFFDLLGIGLIGPYISIILENNNSNFINISKMISDFVKIETKNDLVIIISIVLILTFIFKTILAIIITKLIIDFGVNQKIKIQKKLMYSYANQDYLSYADKNTSNYINSIINFADHYRGALLTLFKTLSELTISISIVCFLLFVNFYAVIILIVIFSSIIFSYNFFFKRKLKLYGKIVNETADASLKKVNETFDGFKELTISNKKLYFIKIFNQNINMNGLYYSRQLLISSAPRYILELILVCLVTFSILFYVFLDLSLIDLLPLLAMFALSGVRLIPSLNIIINGIITGRYLSNSIENLKKDLEKFSNKNIIYKTTNENNKSLIKNTPFENIEFKNVSFSYSNRNLTILNKINIKVNKGEHIAIVGSSGSGKTTLIDLILGLISPNSGEILYNNEPTNSLITDLNNQIAYIPQNSFLIDDTIEANITLGVNQSDIDQSKLLIALKDSQLSKFINNLPNKLKTVVGEKGIQLSGGQKQRISLARAFYFHKDILVLDEATNALDSNTEREIFQIIESLRKTKTVILITHSLSNNYKYDKIFKINNKLINEK